MDSRLIVYGPPGTGKTTRLLEMVETALNDGTPAERIAFVSYTRKAALEARTRAIVKFPHLPEEAFRYFRTLHSIAYRQLGMTRARLCTPDIVARWLDNVGLTVSAPRGDAAEEVVWTLGSSAGDAAIFTLQYAQATGRPWQEIFAEMSHPHLTYDIMEEAAEAITVGKLAEGLNDFGDLLDLCQNPLDVDLLIVDEAQDMSPAQWALCQRLMAPTMQVVVAGDDDQSIYEWAGADAEPLLTLPWPRVTLPISWRLPRAVKAVADGIVARIQHRVPKVYDCAPAAEEGLVTSIASLDHLELPAEGSVLMLARHRYELAKLVTWCRLNGYVYHHNGMWSHEQTLVRAAHTYEQLRAGKPVDVVEAATVVRHVQGAAWGVDFGDIVRWHDIAWPDDWTHRPADQRPQWYDALAIGGADLNYLRMVRARGESLTKPGRVTISTIHGAKGGEAEHVVLLTEQTRRVAAAWGGDGPRVVDAELRVWYVAVTRARLTLTLVGAEGRWGSAPLVEWEGLAPAAGLG